MGQVKMIITMLINKEHLTLEGFMKILAIRAVFPRGLSEKVLAAYPNVKPINKPEFKPESAPLKGGPPLNSRVYTSFPLFFWFLVIYY